MLRKLFCLTLVFLVAYCDNDCVPDQSGFYWTPTCENQGFTNVLIPTGVYAEQNNQSLSSLGGIDATINLVVWVNITNNYNQAVSDPKIDLAIQDYSKSLGKCKWNNIPTLGATDNMDACPILSNCNLNNPANPDHLVITVNIKSIAGIFTGILQAGTYYGISLTFKDGKDNKLVCAYLQDKLIKV